MSTNILTETQVGFIKLLSTHPIANHFYLSGGTALTEFYIPYRLSEDLDFFSFEEFEISEITTFVSQLKKELGFESFEYNSSFNRNLYFLKFPNKSELKIEFTYYPFRLLNKPKKRMGIKIDSVEDIAVNKLFTIYQKPRSRDFIDLYMIIEKYGYTISELMKQARLKFDTNIDPIKLGSQLLLVTELEDYPNLLKPLDTKAWQQFFLSEAKKLKSKILSD